MPKSKKSEGMKESAKSKSQKDKELYAFLATFLSIIGFIIALVAKREDKYVMFYAKQSLVIFIAAVIIGFVRMILFWIPFIGMIINIGLSLLLLAAWLMSWIYALSGKEQDVPIAGDLARKFNF